jgi:Uma2 family endonuclease
MSVATTDYLAAIAHLPAGAVLRIDDVSWEEYENLLADLGECYAVRIFYDRGRMEIMAPASAHEKPKGIIHRLVTTISDELDIVVESLGSTTLKQEMKARGAEPDDCFYIQNAALVIGNDDVNLEHDPAPDLVVEIDHTSSSLNKFSIYAALGVTEIWRVVGKRVDIYLLADDRYEQSVTSRSIPLITASALSDFLVLGLNEGETRVARAVREWLREHQRSSEP